MMAGASKIEWVWADWRAEGGFVQSKPFEQLRMRFAPCLVEPGPHVLSSLRTVAWPTRRNDVVRFCEPTFLEGNDVIKRRGLCSAIRATIVELLHDRLACLWWDRLKSALPRQRASLSLRSERWVASVVFTHFPIGAWLTYARANLGSRQPLMAASAPSESSRALHSPLPNGWPRLNALFIAAFRTNIAAPIEPGLVNLEVRDRLHRLAPAALFLRLRPARNKAPVCLTLIFGAVWHA